MAKAAPKTPIVFRDTAFKSRGIVLADGTMHRVVQGHITAASPELIAHLDRHAEFERVPVVRAAA
ncbi:hypothetical protein [Pseudoduganella namucuonensis]|uniref:Uncharacterized protein n=1 Tax=Pseudoduganella namucuonensis TaxID=1035707 RepID=A0A1I7J394_9BURK|nr:hypothetical protein [Pseudoduganella namucuonensis]SFU79601.1 hypothetical protein SAMN05216552_101019 [Pseudoduganella namucuonensis]